MEQASEVSRWITTAVAPPLTSLSWPMERRVSFSSLVSPSFFCGPCQLRQQSCATRDVDVKLFGSHVRLHVALVASPQTLAFLASRNSIPGKNGCASNGSLKKYRSKIRRSWALFHIHPKNRGNSEERKISALLPSVKVCDPCAQEMELKTSTQQSSEVKRAYDDDGARGCRRCGGRTDTQDNYSQSGVLQHVQLFTCRAGLYLYTLPETLDATIPSQNTSLRQRCP